MKILITGNEGYIGTVLAPMLMNKGHEVTGLDTGFYKRGWLFPNFENTPKTIFKDMRDVTVEDLEGFDAVIAMAELSNDPVGDLVGPLTYEINHKGSTHVAETAKKAGVRKFIYMSSCSVYGVSNGVADETSSLNPQTAYAECKISTEKDLWNLSDENFHPTSLRNATVYGASPRQRFDIVLNNLSGLAWTEKNIAMTSDGTPWRPMVHVQDVCRAIEKILEADEKLVSGEVFNIGSSDSNVRVKDIAEIVADVFIGCDLSFGEPGPDNRSYQVNFDKLQDVLGFSTLWTLEDGAEQMRQIFELIDMDSLTFKSRDYNRLKQIQYLIETGQVDNKLNWVY